MKSSQNSFTLMELLIVVGIIAVLGTAAIALINPWQQIHKAWDTKRKRDLDTLKKVLEDYYNDKSCYPKPEEICYDTPIRSCTWNVLRYLSCHICGNESTSPVFAYMKDLPCDPQHNKKIYLYEIPPKSNINCTSDPDPTDDSEDCPQWYRIYGELSLEKDLVIDEVDCQAKGCGIPPTYGNNYGVVSPNQKLYRNPTYWCFNDRDQCNNCGAYESCIITSNCVTIYGSQELCCNSRTPKPIGCP